MGSGRCLLIFGCVESEKRQFGRMARKLRIQYPGAMYHIINRGNYRKDLFESVGAAEAFLKVLAEATPRFGWKLHAYVLMRNHYHLALETPSPTLVQGMHWLQSTLATRFNRFRRESGHLFQGRYKSILIEDLAALCRVVDYIHLNPVRARIVAAEQVGNYRRSSLVRFLKGSRFAGLTAADWLAAHGGWRDDAEGWTRYREHLVELGRDEGRWKAAGLEGLSRGWAIGSSGWRRKLAEEYAQRVLEKGMERDEVSELRENVWSLCVEGELAALGKTHDDLACRPRKQPWKLELARRVRDKSAAPYRWLADALDLGRPESLRSYLCRQRKSENQQRTA